MVFYFRTDFLILQGLLLLLFYLLHQPPESGRLHRLLPGRWHLLAVNLAVVYFCYQLNANHQLYCRPVPWATTGILLGLAGFLLLPFTEGKPVLRALAAAGTGIWMLVSCYTLWFGLSEYAFVLIMNIVPTALLYLVVRLLRPTRFHAAAQSLHFLAVLTLAPLWMLLQGALYFRRMSQAARMLMAGMPTLLLIVGIGLAVRIHILRHQMLTAWEPATALREMVKNPVDAWLADLLLGAHWKYHTRICVYDGWRPPFHDPVLVLAGTGQSHFDQGMTWQDARELYGTVFPEAPREFACRCASHEVAW